MSKGRKRPLAPEEAALWESVASQAKPLERKRVHGERLNGYRMIDGRVARRDPSAKGELLGHAAWIPAAEGRESGTGPRFEDPTAPEPRRKREDLAPGRLHDMDRRNAERFASGKREIDRKLDLHGMTRARAEVALDRALAEGCARGQRVLLVITGKGGAPAEGVGEHGTGRGVLKRALPEWLNRPRNRERVVAFTPAQPHHGGEGAFYVLLRRQRDR